MELSVGDAAAALGVTPRRVQALISSGRIQARKVSAVWLVDAGSLPTAPRRSRPMSPAVAWAFLADDPPTTPEAAYRWRRRRARLAADPAPETLLVSWVAARGLRELLTASSPTAVLTDPRTVPTGVSDPRSRVTTTGIAEAWVADADADAVSRAYFLQPAPSAAQATVVLHIAPSLPPRPVPIMLLAADLADRGGAQEAMTAQQLIRAALSR